MLTGPSQASICEKLWVTDQFHYNHKYKMTKYQYLIPGDEEKAKVIKHAKGSEANAHIKSASSVFLDYFLLILAFLLHLTCDIVIKQWKMPFLWGFTWVILYFK